MGSPAYQLKTTTLDLSSYKVLAKFNKTLVAKVLNRLREANKALAKLVHSAVQGTSAGCDLELAPP